MIPGEIRKTLERRGVHNRKMYRKKKRLRRKTIKIRNLRRSWMIRFYPPIVMSKEETEVENYAFAAAERIIYLLQRKYENYC